MPKNAKVARFLPNTLVKATASSVFGEKEAERRYGSVFKTKWIFRTFLSSRKV
jgi:hypothetical protein